MERIEGQNLVDAMLGGLSPAEGGVVLADLQDRRLCINWMSRCRRMAATSPEGASG